MWVGGWVGRGVSPRNLSPVENVARLPRLTGRKRPGVGYGRKGLVLKGGIRMIIISTIFVIIIVIHIDELFSIYFRWLI